MKKFKALTVAETLIVLSIIGVVTVLTVASTINIENLRAVKKATLTKNFYINVLNAYQDIILHSHNGLHTITGICTDDNATCLREIFLERLGGEEENDNTVYFQGGIYAQFDYDKDCAIGNNDSDNEEFSSYFNIEDIDEDGTPNVNIRTDIKNVCGVITYSLDNRQLANENAKLGVDYFRIALGRQEIKN